MERISGPDDPRRCQGITAHGQCQYLREDNSEFCIMHGGNRAGEQKKKKDLRNYRLTKFQARTSELANNDNLKSLGDEVGILRMLIEERINSCLDASELLLVSGPLADLVMKCSALVEKCQRLESKLGQHLDRTKVMQFAQVCVEIISNYIDEDDIGSVSDEILKALGEI